MFQVLVLLQHLRAIAHHQERAIHQEVTAVLPGAIVPLQEVVVQVVVAEVVVVAQEAGLLHLVQVVEEDSY